MSGGAERLESAGFGGGRLIVGAAGRSEARYFVTDYLGSVRVVLDASGGVVERNDYYPFGLRWAVADQPVSDNRYRFNGKESQSFLNLPYHDYGARQYDPELALWRVVDPLLEVDTSVSPYAFCGNNPLRFVDPDGRDKWDVVWGYVIGTVTNVSGADYLRDLYRPNDSYDYNRALRACDGTTLLIGGGFIASGLYDAGAGAAVATAGTFATAGAGAPVAVPAGTALLTEGLVKTGVGLNLIFNATTNAGKGYNRGSTRPNEGKGPQHGNPDHDQVINKKVKELKENGIDPANIRKNQQQVDAKGNIVGRNRPDLQWNDEKGIHHNFEVDRSIQNNQRHESVIRARDPDAIFENQIIE